VTGQPLRADLEQQIQAVVEAAAADALFKEVTEALGLF
jgi:hypothetical protein